MSNRNSTWSLVLVDRNEHQDGAAAAAAGRHILDPNALSIFAHCATLRNIASFIGDHYTMCSLIQSNRYAAEFVDDECWRPLCDLKGYRKPPHPFPSFQSYYRVFCLQHDDALSSVSLAVEGEEHSPDVMRAAAAFDGQNAAKSATMRRATAIANFVVPSEVTRKGQMLQAPPSAGPINSAFIIRVGPHLKSLHVLFMNRPEHIFVGAGAAWAPRTTQQMLAPSSHMLGALPFMLPGMVVNVRMVEYLEEDDEGDNKTRAMRAAPAALGEDHDGDEDGHGAGRNGAPAAQAGQGGRRRAVVRRAVVAHVVEFDGRTTERLRLDVPLNLSELCLALAANNASCAIM